MKRPLTWAAAFAALPFMIGTASVRAAEVSAPIQALDQGLTRAQTTSGTPFPARYKALAPAIDQAFDLPQILQTIVGLSWSSIDAGQKTKLLATFRAYTIASYVANFDTDSGDTIKILPETRSIGADRVVETEIVPKSGDPTRIDYVMRQVSGAWRAIDVLEEGTISQAAVQRSDFRSLVAAGADKLIASLQAKVEKLSGGTIDLSASPAAGGQPGTP
jgi:phospholipid transport system substrate-binding protein